MSDSTLKYGVPRTLDDPARFLWWEADQAILVAAFIVFGMVIGSFFMGAMVGVTLGWLYGKSKSGKHKAFAIHALYWHLPGSAVKAVLNFKRTPSSDFREFIG